ncbi:MAG: hypothetical protein J6386_04710 [Candidatus Synoicihabitans palmerolidicus]|nr:hypothetical protein [Candidatus Synoicihabitans palmerolidicus]
MAGLPEAFPVAEKKDAHYDDETPGETQKRWTFTQEKNGPKSGDERSAPADQRVNEREVATPVGALQVECVTGFEHGTDGDDPPGSRGEVEPILPGGQYRRG